MTTVQATASVTLVARLDAEQVAANRRGRGERERQTGGESQADVGHRVPQDDAGDAPARRAERDTDRHLFHPLRHAVADDTVHTKRREQERGCGEDTNQACQQPARPQRAADVLLEQHGRAECLISIDRPDGVADRLEPVAIGSLARTTRS